MSNNVKRELQLVLDLDRSAGDRDRFDVETGLLESEGAFRPQHAITKFELSVDINGRVTPCSVNSPDTRA